MVRGVGGQLAAHGFGHLPTFKTGHVIDRTLSAG